MRDPKRIRPILDEIERYWSRNSDQRLGQVISNITNSGTSSFLYNLEDDELINLLKLANYQRDAQYSDPKVDDNPLSDVFEEIVQTLTKSAAKVLKESEIVEKLMKEFIFKR